MSPNRPTSHVLADRSIAKLHQVFATEGWAVEDLDKDYGEDLLVRIFVAGKATPYTFYVQAKATSQPIKFKRSGPHATQVRLTSGHLRHWSSYWEPVLVVLWDAVHDVFYWEIAQEPETKVEIVGVTAALSLPSDNQLDTEGLQRIAHRTLTRHSRFDAERHGAAVLIERVEELTNIKIDYDPQAGVLHASLPDGRQMLTLWGRLAEIVSKAAERGGISENDAFNHLVMSGSKVFESLHNGAELLLYNSDGIELTRWTSPQELDRYLRRQGELNISE